MTLPLLAAITAATDPDAEKVDSLTSVARAVADRIIHGHEITRQQLRRLMAERFGGSDASGDWSMRDAYDALEAAQVIALLDPDNDFADDDDPAATLAAFELLARALPTQTYRSERQVELQQFSTPLPLAWLAAHAAQITKSDSVLEPSAGTGMLAAHAQRRGAQVILNERDRNRAMLLEAVTSCPVSRHDAEFIHDLLPSTLRPSVVLINPPFSRSEGRGRDRHAGARHLRSALLRLADHGRCVAIMSPAFAPDGSASSGYDSVCALVPPRLEVTITGNPYVKHGTSIDVRLIVFDKGWSGQPHRITVSGVREALPVILAAPSRLGPDDPPPAPALVLLRKPILASAKAGSLFSTIGATRLAEPAPGITVDDSAKPVEYTVLEAPAAAGEQVGIYVPWRLSRMNIPDAASHPDQLVESVAMSSISPPKPSYVPMLPPCAIAALSDAQLETVIYAGQAFDRDLPGHYAPNDAGTVLHPDVEGRPYRMGFFIGDGTGVGKGQQVAACILDRWCRGQRRALWVSKSCALIEDARRDWSALGGLPIDIQPLDAFPFGAPIGMDTGILFVTYATLRSQRHDDISRLNQILLWLGNDFDGLIVFDEAHEMANAAGNESEFGNQKGSEQGLAGVRLQNLLPRACILLASATGATDPANLCYAIRLGLWGPGTAFENRTGFMAAIAGGGIAAMEIVARDLKALGLYTARALTFQGVEYDPLEHALTKQQIEVYDAYADAWQVLCAAAHNMLYREVAIM